MQLEADELVVERGGRTVIRGLSFTLGAGELLVLTGPNGSGKTTLLRTVAGFLTPVAGTLAVKGLPEERERPESTHYVAHADGIKTNLSVAENLDFWCAYLGGASDRIARRDRVLDALERFNLLALADIPGGYLSAGQRRRLGLARLLVADRPLWLLDEPTVSLDAASVALLAGIVKEHLAGGGSAMAATHLPLGIEAARDLRLGPAPVAPADQTDEAQARP